ncbi:NADH dehydrogenase [ubiquinone] 1 alpha subcomplex subunit 12-like [Saccoglossus kowalevskii]|uniref:NADH dehydrogenase [ubiquinone] 1 alpha subcomplex subunit 12 n=1 Tax=Saccoglossus kowalevskii TaxID=10224 RepID=A0ABM0GPT5_SACKO|nr:PREDICTED: NADH dehydrogenase [ubiquinone] 1 alpha subcomplex subunit 12-like [Saccoglossus kowalevskii]
MPLITYMRQCLKAWRVIQQNGGIGGSCWKILRGVDLRAGTLVGIDKYGNKYFKNDNYFVARNRWVEYSPTRYWDFDGSQIPPEWHRWIHQMTDDPPTEVPPVQRKFIWPHHKENLSGTPQRYVPSTTTRPKIESWQPPVPAK